MLCQKYGSKIFFDRSTPPLDDLVLEIGDIPRHGFRSTLEGKAFSMDTGIYLWSYDKT